MSPNFLSMFHQLFFYYRIQPPKLPSRPPPVSAASVVALEAPPLPTSSAATPPISHPIPTSDSSCSSVTPLSADARPPLQSVAMPLRPALRYSIQRTTQRISLNLKRKYPHSSESSMSLGIWDGRSKKFLFKTMSVESKFPLVQKVVTFANQLYMLFRYGFSLFKMENFVEVTVNNFLKYYESFESRPTFETVDEMLKWADLYNLTTLTLQDELVHKGLSPLLIQELVTEEVESVTCLGEHYELNSTEGNSYKCDVTVVATPPDEVNIQFTPSISVPERKLQHTHATFVRGLLNPVYFGMKTLSEVPELVATIEDPELPFTSISALRSFGVEDVAYKIFSREEMADAVLDSIFSVRKETIRINWGAYPHYKAPEVFAPFILDGQHLYYVNAFENAASTMETSAVAAENVARLILSRLYGEISSSSANPNASSFSEKEVLHSEL